MNRFASPVFALLVLSPLGAVGRADDAPVVTYVVYSRSAPDRPWFNGSRYTTEATAVADVARLKKDGCEAFYRAEAPDGGPPAKPQAGTFRVYTRTGPADPWAEVGKYLTRPEADARAAALRKSGFEVFIR